MSQAEPERRKQTRRRQQENKNTKWNENEKWSHGWGEIARCWPIRREWGGSGKVARGGGSCRSEEVRRHSSNCHNLSVTCRMCVNVDPETAQPPPTSYASLPLFRFHSILRDHPLGRDLWQCCRSVVINIYYVTCMHRFQLRSCFLPSQTRLRLRLHLRLLFQLQLQLQL